MANAYVGNPYALVFPVDCDGFLKIPYSRNAGVGTFTANTTNTSTILSNVSPFTGLGVGMPITGTGIPDNTTIRTLNTSAGTVVISNAATATATGVTISFGSHTDITETDLWSHGAGFTVEAVITPYDVNGNGQTGKGKTLEITGPSGSYANGITNRYAQKMMLFSNTSFQFYLENQTTGNVNQPAEYRLAAKVGSTTLNSPTLIKPVSTLHGYYDVKGFYDGMRTSLTEIDTNASLSSSTVISVSQSQTGLLGAGNKIYDSSGTFVDTVASVSLSGTDITLSNAQSSITSTIYKEQPKEALYVNNLYKVSCVLEKSGKLKLFFNNTLVAETAISSFTFDMTNEDCFIGQDGTNVSTQFMGELYEIAMKKGAQPSASLHTLEPGYSDIIFYYRFGDE